MNKLKKLFQKKSTRTFKVLSKKLENRKQELLDEFREKHKETTVWLDEKGIDLETIAKKGSRGALAGMAAGMILISGGLNSSPQKEEVKPVVTQIKSSKIFDDVVGKQVIDQTLTMSLKGELPSRGPLSNQKEKEIIDIVSQSTGVKVAVELDGNRLNTNFGLIGLEQHLPRYPGETLSEHFGSQAGSEAYGKSGMTRNKGAFGYFSNDRFSLSADAELKEKYYVVVQTFLSPGWGKKPGLIDWYKYRKVLVVNPSNGRAIVGDIADSGPALSTGKNFGGSPELMDQLGLYRTQTKGSVLVFFIDETGGTLPLGPL